MSTLSSTALLSGKRFCGTILLCLLATMASHAQTFTTIASFNLTNPMGLLRLLSKARTAISTEQQARAGAIRGAVLLWAVGLFSK